VAVVALDAAGNRSAASSGSFRTLADGCTANCGDPVNLALGRPATQSSVGYGGDPAKAVDGNTDGRYANGSVTHTFGSTQPWWQVDLGAVSALTSVQVFNRTDCCGSRLSNFYVFVSDAPMGGRSLAQLVADPAVARVLVDSLNGAPSITLPLAAQGRYVKLQLASSGTSYLSLAEVQVLGTPDAPPPATNLALGRPASQSSVGYGGDAAKAVDGNTDGRYPNGSVTHTNGGAQSWWQVDLGQVSAVESVRVFNRTDCCGARLSNFHIFVSDTDMSGRSLSQLIADPAVVQVLVGSLSGAPSISVPLVGPGRFVKIQLSGSDYLSLAEVQVFGR
jgi:hypothetical protein